MQVSQLISYPIKSTAPIYHEEIQVFPTGLAHDRHWMIVGRQLTMMTARKYPKLLHIATAISDDQLAIQIGQRRFTTPLQPKLKYHLSVQHWQNRWLGAVTLDQVIDRALSNYLQQPCQLVYSSTAIGHGNTYNNAISFADTAPLLLTAASSLANLNQRLPMAIPMARFRPNIVISGSQHNQEEQWRILRIGNCEFEHTRPCARCILTTIDPQTLAKDPHREPLKTLAQYRRLPGGGVSFGINMHVLRSGLIKVGDSVEIIANK